MVNYMLSVEWDHVAIKERARKAALVEVAAMVRRSLRTLVARAEAHNARMIRIAKKVQADPTGDHTKETLEAAQVLGDFEYVGIGYAHHKTEPPDAATAPAELR